MIYQILMKDREGRNILLPEQMQEQQADTFVQYLSNSGIEAIKIEHEEKKINVVSVVFKLDDTMMYTFEDPNNIAQVGDIVEVECTDGRKKLVLVKASGKRTRKQIDAFCAKIGYKTLRKVMRLVWRPSRK